MWAQVRRNVCAPKQPWKKHADMEDSETLEPYELRYSDIVRLSSSIEDERGESITKTIMETLGPKGPALLSITAVPKTSTLRRNLLPLARDLALLNSDDRKRILKEHNLGSDVSLRNPDRSVSSFAMQLRYSQGYKSDRFEVDRIGEFQDLGNMFKELGFCMMEIGLCLARICDRAIGGRELEQSILESATAKGRLVHYHSALDNFVLKEQSGRRNRSSKKLANSPEIPELGLPGNHSNDLWQQWHYDYGIFTVLTSPMFLSPSTEAEDQFPKSSDQECPSPAGHSYLQIFDPSKNKVFMVKASPESFIVQVGESADILSKGKLHSTLHCVCRPAKLENLSRETFVVFLQPSWSKIFSISDYLIGVSNEEENRLVERDVNKIAREIRKIVPPLSSRLKDGMTFAEFSQETTKQYYGGSGLQSNAR